MSPLPTLVVGGATVVSLTSANPVADNTDFICGITWKADDFKFVLNTDATLSDNAGAVPTGLTTGRIGSPTTAANMWQGPIKQLAYFARALTDAKLRAALI